MAIDESMAFESFTVVIERDDLDGGFVAHIQEYPGCVDEGATPQEALDNVIAAFQTVLEVEGRGHAELVGRPMIQGSPSVDDGAFPRRVALAPA